MLTDVDYHIHTSYSDGDFTPEQIVDRYLAQGYERIAITDHDGIEGSMVALFYSSTRDIQVIPGIEISTRDRYGNNVHILGYYINYSDCDLNSALSDIRLKRAKRNDKLLEVLRQMGYNITIEELIAVNDGNFIGKPTFAKVLVNKGFASDVDEVFKGLFKDERIRPLTKETLDTDEAIRLINNAGGIAVLAHPMEIKRPEEEQEEFYSRIRSLVDEYIRFGLDGIECYHPSATMTEAEMFRELARSMNLCITKGSDFHSEASRRNYEG